MMTAVKYRAGCFPKICACGQTYSEEAWLALEYCGIQPGSDPATGRRYAPDFEMRNCECHSSIMVPIE